MSRLQAMINGKILDGVRGCAMVRRWQSIIVKRPGFAI
jgi:hypothetical protein